MKILFLTRRAWPEIGGVERHVLEVGKRLVEKGNEVTVVAEDDGSFIRPPLAETPTDVGGKKWSLVSRRDAFKTTQGETFKTHRIPVGRNQKLKKFWIWWWLWRNRKLIEEAEIVHAHDVGFWYWPFRFFYSRKPFFMTFHGYEQYPVPFKNKIIHKISEKMARGNLCVGDFLKKWYGTRADYVIYGGVDVPPRRSHGFTDVQPATIRGETTSEVRTLFVGRLDEQTGIMTYLRALNILNSAKSFTRSLLAETPLRLRAPRGQGETFETTILGDGPLKNKVEKYLKENKLNAQVLGEVGDMGVLGELRGKARFVFASGYLSILEAMAEGKLVFSVFDNPLKEDYLRLGELGKLVVICESEKELAEKIKFYLENPQKEKKMIDLAYNWVKGETWEKVTERYLDLWSFAKGFTRPPLADQPM